MDEPAPTHRFSVELADDGAARTDLTARQEMKYVFAAPDPTILRAALRRTRRPVAYADRVSTVRSVYFDDHRLHTCHANLDGVGLRQKLRLRWYDRATPDRDLFLEVKWRRHRVTGKRRLHLVASEEAGCVPYRALLAALRRDLPPEHQEPVLAYDQPVVLVEYKREHFESPDGEARLTLDYDMRFYPQGGRRAVCHRFGHRLDGVVLIEGKVAVGNTLALREIVQHLPVRPSRFSKYVVGCQRLGLVSDG